MSNIDCVLDSISLDRLADDLWRLVSIPSPTGHERAALLAYADMLRDAGAEVEVDEANLRSPNAIGRLKGARPGRTFQLAGHIDHIDVPHADPARTESTISGRGSADMKNGLAAILEIVRVLKSSGAEFAGEILVTVYGMHEAPVGDASGVRGLIERGVTGDAALVMESTYASEGKAVVAGLGMSVWDIALRRSGEACHELNRPAAADELLAASLAIASALRAHDQALRARDNVHPLLRPESLFTGQLHYGDFYNRAATTCALQGTRRWHPDRTFQSVQKELEGVIESTSVPAGIEVSSDWTFCGDAYQIDPNAEVVRAFRSAYATVTGRDMPVAGTAVVTDVNHLVTLGRVPAIQCGFDHEFAHGDREYIRIGNLLEPCKVSLLTAWNYLAGEEQKT